MAKTDFNGYADAIDSYYCLLEKRIYPEDNFKNLGNANYQNADKELLRNGMASYSNL